MHGMGNSYHHGLGHKCSRWRPRVHSVNTYLLMVTCRVDKACLVPEHYISDGDFFFAIILTII